MVAGAGMQGRVHADLPVSGPVRTIITPRGRVCAVHAGGFRRKGGDSQCVVVLVHKEGAGARLECPWYVGRSL
jgi:hypothetical protein